MPNVIDYVETSQYDSFYDKNFTVLDALALTEIAYLPFDGLVPSSLSPDDYLSLHQLATQFEEAFQQNYPALGMVTPHRLKLLGQLANYKRYRQIHALAFANEYSLDSQKQFAAITYQIRPKEYLVVFRGTDDTLIGWKEDFHMTYMAEIPAQIAAKDYLHNIITRCGGRVWVAGHSKGGNLATYAASQIETDLQDRIQGIYSFDAPGLHSSILTSDGFKAIESKMVTIIPENSIVGMMLETPKTDRVVKSTAFGLLQHVTFSWEIVGNDFKEVPKVTDDSVQVDRTLKTWTASLSEDELRDFFDLFFGIFIEAGIQRFGDITIDTPGKIQKVLQNSQNMTPQEKAMMERVSRLLIDTRFQIWKDHLPTLPKLEDFNLQESLPDLDPRSLTKTLRTLITDKETSLGQK